MLHPTDSRVPLRACHAYPHILLYCTRCALCSIMFPTAALQAAGSYLMIVAPLHNKSAAVSPVWSQSLEAFIQVVLHEMLTSKENLYSINL